MAKRDGPCPAWAHMWKRETMTVAVEVDGEITEMHTYPSDRCTRCGAVRRARDVDGKLLPEIVVRPDA